MRNKDEMKAAKKLLARPPGPWQKIDLTTASTVPTGCTRAYKNNRFVVTVYDDSPTTHGPAIQVLVQRHDDQPIPGHWRQLFELKNELFGPEALAIEYHPPLSELTDQANIYWLWIFPEGVIPKRLIKGVTT